MREILPDVDLLKISEEEADMLGGEAELPALMERYGLTPVSYTHLASPVFVTLLAGIFLKEKITPVKIASTILCLEMCIRDRW